MRAGKEIGSTESLWDIRSGKAPSQEHQPTPFGPWQVESHEEVADFGRHENLTASLGCATQYHCRIGQIIECPCSACSCVYYWCNWKPSQKEDKKRRKKKKRERKQHVLVLAYDTWDILYQNKWAFVWGRSAKTHQQRCIYYLSKLWAWRKQKAYVNPQLGFRDPHLDICCTSFTWRQPTQLGRESKKDSFVRERIPLSAWLWAALV